VFASEPHLNTVHSLQSQKYVEEDEAGERGELKSFRSANTTAGFSHLALLIASTTSEESKRLLSLIIAAPPKASNLREAGVRVIREVGI
jgi:hypothetical protein